MHTDSPARPPAWKVAAQYQFEENYLQEALRIFGPALDDRTLERRRLQAGYLRLVYGLAPTHAIHIQHNLPEYARSSRGSVRLSEYRSGAGLTSYEAAVDTNTDALTDGRGGEKMSAL